MKHCLMWVFTGLGVVAAIVGAVMGLGWIFVLGMFLIVVAIVMDCWDEDFSDQFEIEYPEPEVVVTFEPKNLAQAGKLLAKLYPASGYYYINLLAPKDRRNTRKVSVTYDGNGKVLGLSIGHYIPQGNFDRAAQQRQLEEYKAKIMEGL